MSALTRTRGADTSGSVASASNTLDARPRERLASSLESLESEVRPIRFLEGTGERGNGVVGACTGRDVPLDAAELWHSRDLQLNKLPREN